MKKVLSLAIAAALVAPAAAMADATLFGKAHFIVENVDEAGEDAWGVDSVHSRIGVKGSEDLGNGLSALYHFEFRVNQDAGNGLNNRNQFVGLAGGFGTVLLGRHDTPLKMAQGKFDQFGDLPHGDINAVMPGENRLDNVIAYVSPAMGGLTFVGAAVAGENGDGAGGELDGLADHISLAGLYSNGPIFASLAYNSYDLGQVSDADPSLLRGTFIWNGGMWQAGVMFASTDADDVLSLDDGDAVGLSGNVKVGPGKIKAQWLQGDQSPTSTAGLISPSVDITAVTPGTDLEETQWSIGYEQALSKRTTVHVGYTNNEVEGRDDDTTSFFGGIIHNF